MVKVFLSGSCRLLTTIGDGRGKIEPIHSMFHNFVGINFLGKLHNSKQHIHFVKWIHDEIELPPDILSSFLTSYSTKDGIESSELNPEKKNNIRAAFKECDYYIFEICSLKLYERRGYQVQFELTDLYETTLQSDADLCADLRMLRDMIPEEKRIIFQVHFRPNIIYHSDSTAIDKRETIHRVVSEFCGANKNVRIYDPSIVIRADKTLFDGDTHFTDKGHETSFNYLYEHFLQK
jgi:hypothetical protein